jgi:hypothetical protein
MTEELIGFGAGIIVTLTAVWGFRRAPSLPVVPLASEFDGWVYDPPATEAHEHDGHIAGTAMRGGVKHKRMYCSRCPKKWSEPC